MPGLEIRERQFDYGPQRRAWICMVEVATLREAAKIQLEYHQRRLGVWKVRLAKAQKKEAASLKAVTQNVTGGMQTLFQADALAAQQKQLAESKVVSHQQKVDEFREWVTAFQYDHDHGSNAGFRSTLPCTIDDLEYFKLSHYTPKEK